MTKAEHSRQLRYRKAALAELGYEQIRDRLYEISGECENIRWIMDGDIDTLTNALDGDEEEAYEFRMMFAELSAECEQLWSAIDEYEEQHFDDCSVALIGNRFEAVGYDDFQEDYYSLTSYESELAVSESGKRIMRMAKPEMLQEIGRTLGIILSFQNVQYKYEYLKATMDILNGENASFLQTIKDIEAAYEKANEDGFHEWERSVREFDRLIGDLPDKTWIE
jgi:chromosome segregation ATPase